MDHSVLRCTRKYYCVGWPYLLIAPRVPALQVPGGRDFVYPKYPKQLDRARRNLKPTSSPISKCGRSRLNPFLDACHAIALQRTCSAQPAIRWLVGWSTLRPRLTRAGPPRLALTPRTRRMQRCGRPSKTPTTSARRRPAPPEPPGPRHRGRLSPATVRRSATVPSPGATHLAIWTSSIWGPAPLAKGSLGACEVDAPVRGVAVSRAPRDPAGVGGGPGSSGPSFSRPSNICSGMGAGASAAARTPLPPNLPPRPRGGAPLRGAETDLSTPVPQAETGVSRPKKDCVPEIYLVRGPVLSREGVKEHRVFRPGEGAT
jgi:hypothetical protein